VAGVLARAGERGLIARGLGRSYGDAAQNAGGLVLDMTGLAQVKDLDLEADRVTVAAGVSIDELTRLLVPLGRFLPVVPGTGQVTVGGAIASDIHGKNHHRDGGFGAHVLELDVLTPAGERLKLEPGDPGGAFDATVGGMGLTGIILEATLRLLRIETSRVLVDTDRAGDLDDAMARMEAGDASYRYSVAWIDCLARGSRLGRSILLRGDHAKLADLEPRERDRPLAMPASRTLAAPPWAPGGLLRGSTLRAFNEAWFRRAPVVERGHVGGLRAFFHPLDAVRGWNRLYGPRGLLQLQFVVPFGQEGVVRAALERLSAARAPSLLSVLKRMGPRSGGQLSFSMPGWTLALDLPAGDGDLVGLLDQLDRRVADAGGRVYLAKDSRLRPELLSRMYPGLDRWREARARLDPASRMRSDLSRRLGLVG
jgi:decaprenylphospho-beta-D-ribofuranose 2-oxidase